jgi:hypothetical protein
LLLESLAAALASRQRGDGDAFGPARKDQDDARKTAIAAALNALGSVGAKTLPVSMPEGRL